VLTHCRWDQLKGTYKASAKEAARGTEAYNRAKKNFDQEAADELVERAINRVALDAIIDAVIALNKPARVVVPHPEFNALEPADDPAKPTNALPFAFAAYLAAETGGTVDSEIIEVARPGRTRLGNFPRFLWQPVFDGAVRQDCAYIIADDNCTLGGTIAALRSHIIRNGGTIAAITSLSTNHGVHFRLPVAPDTVDMLISIYSGEISGLCKEEIGHDVQCLTQPEGAFLAGWGSDEKHGARPGASAFQRLRDRLAAAAGKAK
jgi:hypothetical protein